MRPLIILMLCMNAGFVAKAQQLDPDSTWSLPDNLRETSGISFIGTNIISHNDSGHPNLLIETTSEGAFVKTYTIENAKNVDWEELCSDDHNYYYIGDFGNNLHKRKNLCVYKVDLTQNRVFAEKIEFTFSDQVAFPPAESNKNFDCEAMFWLNKRLYLFSKNDQKPYSGYTKRYVLNDQPGMQQAMLLDSFLLGKGGLLEHSVTAAAYDKKHNRLALLTYQHLFLFYDFEGNDFFGGKVMQLSMGAIRQRESIVFDANGDLWGSDEKRVALGGRLYFYSLTKWLRAEHEYDRKEISDVLCKADAELLSISFRTSVPGNYNLQIRGGVGASFQLYQSAEMKNKNNEGKEVLFGKITIPGNIEKHDAVICIYNDQRLVFCRSFKKFIK